MVGETIRNISIFRSDPTGSGWWYGERETGEAGYFPGNYVKLMPDQQAKRSDTLPGRVGQGGSQIARDKKPVPTVPSRDRTNTTPVPTGTPSSPTTCLYVVIFYNDNCVQEVNQWEGSDTMWTRTCSAHRG